MAGFFWADRMALIFYTKKKNPDTKQREIRRGVFDENQTDDELEASHHAQHDERVMRLDMDSDEFVANPDVVQNLIDELP